MKRLISIFSAIFISSLSTEAQSTPPIEIGIIGNKHVAVSAASANQRVGDGLLIRVHLLSQPNKVGARYRLGESYVLLVACDGSWISTPIQSTFQLAESGKSFSDLESYAKSFEVNIPLDMAKFEIPSDSELEFAPLIAKSASYSCRTAAREPKNFVIPVGLSKTIGEVYSSYGIVLGTQSREKNLIDIWTRTTDYAFVDILDEDGKPYEVDGLVKKRKENNGRYIMQRGVFDCKNKSVAPYETIVYDPKNSSPESISTPRDKAIQTSIVPNSVGEAELDAICRLYWRTK